MIPSISLADAAKFNSVVIAFAAILVFVIKRSRRKNKK